MPPFAVRDEDVVLLGYRDEETAAADGSQDVRGAGIHALDLAQLRAVGAREAAAVAVRTLRRPELEGFWVHLDADVLDDAIMPAVGYRLPGGLGADELGTILHTLVGSGRAVGLSVAIYNPTLDPAGVAGERLASALVVGLGSG